MSRPWPKWSGTIEYTGGVKGPERQFLTVEADDQRSAVVALLKHPHRRHGGAVLYESVQPMEEPCPATKT